LCHDPLRQLKLLHSSRYSIMDDDSVNFGSDTAGATPGSILAQPPLQGEDTPGEGAGMAQPPLKNRKQLTRLQRMFPWPKAVLIPDLR